jgi:CheY-like chemotaxis protein
MGLMGGSITFISEAGVGTQFAVLLPVELDYGLPEISTAPLPVEPLQSLPDSTWPAYSILLIDDNEINLRVAKALFEKMGQTVETKDNGFEALSFLLSPSYLDVVFMDIQMPGLDGYSLFQLLEAMPILQTVPIVALTAFAGKDDQERLLAWGFDDVLVKPVTLDKTKDILTKVDAMKRARVISKTDKLSFLNSPLVPASEVQNLVDLLGREELTASMVSYLEELQVWVEEVTSGRGSLGNMLHSLKGTGGTLRLKAIEETCKYYESKVRREELVVPEEVIRTLSHISEVSVRFAMNLINK